jgi:ribosome-associated translation inhibitor RaiA
VHIQTISRNNAAGSNDQRYAQWLSESFSRYFRTILQVHWTLSAQGERCVAACHLHAKSGIYHAVATSKNFRKSLDLVFERILKQRRRRKGISLQQVRTGLKSKRPLPARRFA